MSLGASTDRLRSNLKVHAPVTWRRLTGMWMTSARALQPAAMVRDDVLSRWSARSHREAFSEVERFVMFVGYSRSGHSLVGSLLNAHPHIVIGHQLDALRYLRAGFSRDQIYAMLLVADARYERRGRVSNKGRFDYSVPGEWQGRFSRLRVIGDKRGESSTNALHEDPSLLERLQRSVGVPVRLIHVIRNPYDNISTMAVRYRTSIPAATDRYFGLCAKIAGLRRTTTAAGWLDLRHEAVIADPAASLGQACRFLGVVADDSYLEHCASIVYDRPHQSRRDAPWTAELIDDVRTRMAAHPFLDGYAYDEGPGG